MRCTSVSKSIEGNCVKDYLVRIITKNANVRVAVYNVLGQEVAVLADGMHPAGYYDLSWNGKGKDGRSVASGIYFCRLRSGDFITTQRMVLMK